MDNQFNSNEQYKDPEQPKEPQNFQYSRSTYNTMDTSPLSLGQYLGIMFLMLIPLVNIILLFIWSFGNNNVNKRNYARATLIMFAIFFILWIILIIAFGSMAIRYSNQNII